MSTSTALPMDMLDAYRSQIYSQLMQSVPDVNTRLVEVCRYALGPAGKMLRPLLLLEACQAVGGDPRQVLLAAAGTEFGHIASLVHDDLIDGDELRRGQETVWKRYGRDFAILTGDLMIFQAFHCLAMCREHGVPAERVAQALQVMAQSCIDLCLGQDMEAAVTGDLHAGVDAYLRVIRHKTGALFRASCEVGAVLGGGTPEQVAALTRYGDYMGLAFQIVDDLLCYRSSASEMGKSVLSDLRNARITLPILLAYEEGAAAHRPFLEALFTVRQPQMELELAHRRLVQVLNSSGALERSAEMARSYIEIARQNLHTLPDSPSRATLDAVLTLATERQR